MAYVRLYDLLPEVAMAETSLIVLDPVNAYNIPGGEYGLVEMYCDDADCDCQRVFLAVMQNEPDAREPLAVVTFGWESLDYYTKWFNMGRRTPYSKLDPMSRQAIQFMHGAHLSNTNKQSKIAPAIFEMLNMRVFNDEFYLNRLKQHYKMFRAKVNESHKSQNVILFPNRRPKK